MFVYWRLYVDFKINEDPSVKYTKLFEILTIFFYENVKKYGYTEDQISRHKLRLLWLFL